MNPIFIIIIIMFICNIYYCINYLTLLNRIKFIIIKKNISFYKMLMRFSNERYFKFYNNKLVNNPEYLNNI